MAETLLRTQYPEGFDAKNGCWKAHYGEGDAAMAYCMRPLPPANVTEAGANVVYVATASAADIEGDPDYRYGATDPGMFDAFRIEVGADGTPHLRASSTGMDFGSAGDCACSDADFVALGPDVHGWVFSSGTTNQGATSSTHSLIAPVGAAFKDVAAIAQYVEDEPDTEYRLAVGRSNAVNGWFPLTVTRYRNGERMDSRTARFDPALQRYRLPDSP